MSDKIQRARDALAAGFTSEAARKEILTYCLGREFEKSVHDSIHGKICDAAHAKGQSVTDPLAWSIPAFANWRHPKHSEMFAAYPDEVKLANELVALRNEIKVAALVAKAPTKTSIARDERNAVAKTCQICGRPILAESGVIAHHGYKRPGHGWQTASCFGARRYPFEKSRDALGEYIELLKDQTKRLAKHELETAAERTPFAVSKTTYSGPRKKDRHVETENCTRANFAELKKAGFEVRGFLSFDELLASKVKDIRRDHDETVTYTKFQQERFNTWKAVA